MTYTERLQIAVEHRHDPRYPIVWKEGYKAEHAGQGRMANPYPDGSPDWLWWTLGFEAAEGECR